MMIYKVSGKKISEYQIYLIEKSRPPSRGGNGKALHSHVVIIDGVKYSFLANDSRRWIFKSDTVSFEYKIENGFNNIVRESITTLDNQGIPIIRGNRGYTKKMRTADTRLPGSRRECKD
ncbi:MAG: hypothetical protein E7G96_02710 [Serratia liquefaciens]|nr:hypothetical protein [Serratia liquefaciens]